MARVTITQAAEKWKERVQEARKENKYCKGIAEFLGVSPDTVCNSLPAQHWNSFDLDVAKKHYIEDLKRAYGVM